MKLSQEKLAELLAKARAGQAKVVNPNIPAAPTTQAPAPAPAKVVELPSAPPQVDYTTQAVGMNGEAITYNAEQAQFIRLAAEGKSCVLLGPAGTGKSTCQRGAGQALIASGHAGILQANGHKYLQDNTPGIVICAFTRRAVNNIRKVLPADLRNNCITIHKLLEYEPVSYEIDGKKTMRFEPARTSKRPLPASIHTIIFEESSMISTELHAEVMAACPHNPQCIYIGDIQQLPPVFGSAILGYKMLELPVIELKHVYRQALESPIIRLAHRILSGKPIPVTEYSEWEEAGKLKLHAFKKKLSADLGLLTVAKFFKVAADDGAYNPTEDMILIPFNKAFGTDELNKHIAQHISSKQQAITHEVVAGYNKHYFAVGDKVMYEKEDAIIVSININGMYSGVSYQEASHLLDRWGHRRIETNTDDSHTNAKESQSLQDVEDLLDNMAFDEDSEETKREASHVITIQLLQSGEEVELSKAGQVNNMALAYAITVHKSQGSEARKVFLVLHNSHATMLQRELLYTAVTRARESLYVICEPETFTKGITSQKLKGDTLAEKAEYFKGKLERNEQQKKFLESKSFLKSKS